LFVDLSASPQIYPGLRNLARVRIRLSAPDASGFAGQNEDKSLMHFEDRLAQAFEKELHGKYVGWFTVAGARIFYCYLPDNIPDEKEILKRLPGARVYSPEM